MLSVLQALTSDAEALRNLRRQVLVKQGLELLDEDACPLCDKAWDMQELQAHLEDKLAKAAGVAETLHKLQETLQPIINGLEDLREGAKKIISICKLADAKLETQGLNAFSEPCEKEYEALESVTEDPASIDDVIGLLTSPWKLPSAVGDEVVQLKKHVESLPDPSKEDEARDFLSVAQERYDRCRVTKTEREASAKTQ